MQDCGWDNVPGFISLGVPFTQFSSSQPFLAQDSDSYSVLTQYPYKPVGMDFVERIWIKGR